jgi:uncharacterized protein (TIGR02596 family)
MVRGLKQKRAFTLIELLVVVGIIAVLAVAIIPSIRGVSDSYSLTSAADQVVGLFNLARQTAIAKNRPVQIRIYQMPATTPGGQDEYRLIAAVMTDPADPAKDMWVDKLRLLPTGVIFDDGSRNDDYSSLIALADPSNNSIPRKSPAVTNGVPFLVKGRPYIFFTIRPDGSTDLESASNQAWTLSLRPHRDIGKDSSPARPAYNFITLMVDPVLGTIKVFRP